MEVKTMIPIDVLRNIAKDEGCTLTEKATCVMVTRGKSPNRLYIAKTREVARVNVNGFKIPDPELAATPKGGPVGTFLQVVRFDHPEAKVLANFRHICRELDAYASTPKKERQRPASFKRTGKGDAPSGPDIEVKSEESPEEHAERLIGEFQKKRRIAAEMGYPLSKKTVEEYQRKVQELGRTLEA